MVKIEDVEIIQSAVGNKWYLGTLSKKEPEIMNNSRKEIPDLIIRTIVSEWMRDQLKNELNEKHLKINFKDTKETIEINLKRGK